MAPWIWLMSRRSPKFALLVSLMVIAFLATPAVCLGLSTVGEHAGKSPTSCHEMGPTLPLTPVKCPQCCVAGHIQMEARTSAATLPVYIETVQAGALDPAIALPAFTPARAFAADDGPRSPLFSLRI